MALLSPWSIVMFELSKKVTGLKPRFYPAMAVLAFCLAPVNVSAGLITTNSPGYTMVDFLAPTGASASSATSVNGDVVMFTEKNGSLLDPLMLVGNTNSETSPWWSSTDPADTFYYYTDVNDQNWVELVMPKYTVGFTLAIDSNFRASAWIMGVADDGSAIDTLGNAFTMDANGDFSPSPAFNIPLRGSAQTAEFYANNSGGTCNTIQKVVIEPQFWGMGNFSIAVDENACGGEVSEPSILALMGLGLVGLGLVRRRKFQAQ